MAQTATAMDIRTATALVGQVENVAAFCRAHAISRVTFYKWRRRFMAEGVTGLQERSRRPRCSPGRTEGPIEELVVTTRQALMADGLDHGPQSIAWALARRGVVGVPSRATVARILVRHGVIDPQPRKRPKSATKRFVFGRPNECWQSDWTQWQLADGSLVSIAGTLDDHSRYLAALSAAAGAGTSELVWAVMLAGIGECGIPSMSLTDNGLVYTGRRKGFESAFEANLRALGTHTINSRPFHPQTCGKIERFWQTLKKWLLARPAPDTTGELNELLAQFRGFYNYHRPHRALRGTTPAEAFIAAEKARPATRPLSEPVFLTRHTVSAQSGRLAVPPYMVNVGLRWADHVCDAVRDGDHIVIFSGTKLIRELTANPARQYQPIDPSTRTYRTREPQPTS
jgi:transposase InsO family protein